MKTPLDEPWHGRTYIPQVLKQIKKEIDGYIKYGRPDPVPVGILKGYGYGTKIEWGVDLRELPTDTVFYVRMTYKRVTEESPRQGQRVVVRRNGEVLSSRPIYREWFEFMDGFNQCATLREWQFDTHAETTDETDEWRE